MQMPSQPNSFQNFNETKNWIQHLEDNRQESCDQDSQFPPNTSRNQILNDARILVKRIQDRDKLTDSLILYAQSVTEKINCLKEYKENLTELQEMRIGQQPRSALVANLQQENRQIKILQEENRQLKLALEEHQATLDMIMQRYRQQVVEMVKLNKLQQLADKAVGDAFKSSPVDDGNKLLEYASLFDHCLKVGEDASTKDQEELTRLKTENQTLRQLLKIAAQNDLAQPMSSSSVVETKNVASKSSDSVCSAEESTVVASTVSSVSKSDSPVDETTPTTSSSSDPVPALRKKSASRSGSTSSQKSKSAEKSDTPTATSVVPPTSDQATVLVKPTKINVTCASVTATVSVATTTTTKSVPRTVLPTTTVSKVRAIVNAVQPKTVAGLSNNSAVKKSVSQDSCLVNGGVKSATPAKNATPSSGTVKRKSSAGDLKNAPANQTTTTGTVQTKQSTNVQQKSASAKSTPSKSVQNR